jgi:hypothetical protein
MFRIAALQTSLAGLVIVHLSLDNVWLREGYHCFDTLTNFSQFLLDLGYALVNIALWILNSLVLLTS